MKTLLDYNLTELQEVLNKFGAPSFRAKQIFTGLHQGKSISEINIKSKCR